MAPCARRSAIVRESSCSTGPVDDRDDDEQHRPQQRDSPYWPVVEDVAGDREVGEGEDPRRRRSRPTARARRGRRRRPRAPADATAPSRTASPSHPRGRAAWSRGTASAPRRPRRGGSAARRRRAGHQWLRCPGVLPRSRTYAPRARFEPAPERLARHGDEQPARAPRAPSRATVCSRVGHVLEHLDRARPGRTRRRRTAGARPASRGTRGSARARVAHSAWSAGSSRSIPTTRGRRAACAQLLRRARPRRSRRRAATAGPRSVHSSSSARSKAGHQPADDRVGRAVLVVGVAGDRPLGVDASPPGAHAWTASRSRPSGRPRRPSSAAARSARRRARSARAATPSCQLDAPHALEDPLAHDPLAAEQVADDAERREQRPRR